MFTWDRLLGPRPKIMLTYTDDAYHVLLPYPSAPKERPPTAFVGSSWADATEKDITYERWSSTLIWTP